MRYWLCAAALSVVFVAPEAWTAYAIQEAVKPECPEVEVTCMCEVQAEEPVSPRENVVSSGVRTGDKQWWE